MKRRLKLGLFLAKLVSICLIIVSISLAATLYYKRSQPVFLRSDGVDCCPMLFVQNPFRDKSKEMISDDFLRGMKGKTVTEFLSERKDVSFNNPSGIIEQGKLVKWELMNRKDTLNETDFHYGIYRDDQKYSSDELLLSFVVVKVVKINSQWKPQSYRCEGTSNNS